MREGDHTLQSVIAIGASWNVGMDGSYAPDVSPAIRGGAPSSLDAGGGSAMSLPEGLRGAHL